MSGFKTEKKTSGSKFANLSKGWIVVGSGDDRMQYGSLTGSLIDFYTEEAEYEGKGYTKLVLCISHNGVLTLLGFSISSGYGQAFCRIAPNIDPKAEIEISASYQAAKNDKSPDPKRYGSLFISQHDKPLKWFFTNTNDNGKLVPAVKEVKIGTGKNARIEKDYSERQEFFDKVLAKVHKKVQEAYPLGMEGFKKEKHVDAADITEPLDDLPF